MRAHQNRQSQAAPKRTQSDADGLASRPVGQDGSDVDSLIRIRAYELYLARGGHPGEEIDDWLQAEHEVREHAHAGASSGAGHDGRDSGDE